MLYNNSRRRLLLNETERQGMRVAGQFNAQLFDEVRAFIRPGVTTAQIDHLVETYVRDHGHTAASKGYPGQAGPFPASCCTSVNDVVCHGVPDQYLLKEGLVGEPAGTTNVPLNAPCSDAEHAAMAQGAPLKFQS